jgi:hypothetical protein
VRQTRGAGLMSLALLLGGCEGWWQSYSLRKYQGEIDAAARAVDAAQNDAQRALAHTARGRACSEKARYARAFKLIPPEEYGRLFDLAVEDHDRAVALAPGDAEVYLSRGRTYYDRAALVRARHRRLREGDRCRGSHRRLRVPARQPAGLAVLREGPVRQELGGRPQSAGVPPVDRPRAPRAIEEGLAPRIVEVAAARSLYQPGVRLVEQKHRRRGDEAKPDPRDPDGTGRTWLGARARRAYDDAISSVRSG